EMIESQPDIAQQKVIIRLTELSLLAARNQLLPKPSLKDLHLVASLGLVGDLASQVGPGVDRLAVLAKAVGNYAYGPELVPPDAAEFIHREVGLVLPDRYLPRQANTRQAQYQLLRQRATLRQITHQTTHTLARFFLEVDANYKQYSTARRLN